MSERPSPVEGDKDMGDISLSESSWADAEMTLGQGRSDSEDTLSNLSFDNDVVADIPLDSGENPAAKNSAEAGSVDQKRRENNGAGVNVRVQLNDFEMDEDDSLHLNLPPGQAYKPPTVDFPLSPSQLKISQGASFMPTEEPALISEDESSINSYHALLGLNGNVRMTKREEEQQQKNNQEEFLQAKSYLRLPSQHNHYPSLGNGEPESLQLDLEDQEEHDDFDDYIEDFFNPLSNEPVMQRATSFRRKVQKQFEEAVVEKSLRVINNFDAMLSSYDQDPDNDNVKMERSSSNDRQKMKTSTPQKCAKCQNQSQKDKMCYECNLKELNRSKSDSTTSVSKHHYQDPSFRVSAIKKEAGLSPNGLTMVSNESGDISQRHIEGDDSPKEYYDPEWSILAHSMDRGNGITYGRGSDAAKDRKNVAKIARVLNFEDQDPDDILQSEPQSLLDIDAICKLNAPNLMNSIEPQSFQILHHHPSDEDFGTSNYFLPQDTLHKIESVFESNNFNNLYTLSGELKHILTPMEIEEIVANKDHLAGVLGEDVMAVMMSLPAFSTNNSVVTPNNINNNKKNNNNNLKQSDRNNSDGEDNDNEDDGNDSSSSLNIQNNNLLNNNNGGGTEDTLCPIIMDGSTKDDQMHTCFSSATSISNGFHSKESSLTDVSDQNELDEAQNQINIKNKKIVPVKDKYLGDDGQEGDEVPTDVSKHNNNSNNSQKISESSSQNKHNILNGSGAFQRGTTMTNSLRRRIALAKDVTSEDLPQKYVEDDSVGMDFKNSNPNLINSGNSNSSKTIPSDESAWKSLESLDDLDVEDGIESRHDSENGDDDMPKMFLVRRDSKRFNKGTDAARIIQGIFVESKNTNGTLRRIKVPLNIADDADTVDHPGDTTLGDKSTEDEDDLHHTAKEDLSSLESSSSVKSPRSHKKRISVDDKILSIASETEDNSFATDVTQSDVFHSIINSVRDEDKTIRSDDDEEEDITLDLDTPDEMEHSILEQLESIASDPNESRERIPELSAAEELEDERNWKSFRVGANDIQIDLKAIQPYRRVLSHGGYFDAERKVAIILFSGCFLPDRSRKEYSYLMDHLFLYVLSSLEELIVEDYILVYLHGATPKSCMPTFSWLKRCYQLIDRRLRKNLKGLYLVHPTFWLKTVVALTKPFVSSKFSRKLQFVNTLADLCLEIPTEHLVIADPILQYDADRQQQILLEIAKNRRT